MGIFLTLLRAMLRFADEPLVLRAELDFRAEIRFAGDRRAIDRFFAGLLRAVLRRTALRAVVFRAVVFRAVLFRAVLLRAVLRRTALRAVVFRAVVLRADVFRLAAVRFTGLRRTLVIFRLAEVRRLADDVRFTGFRRAVVARRVAVLRRLADEVRAFDFLAAEGLRAALFVAGMIVTVRNCYPSDGAVAPPLMVLIK